MSHPKHSRYKKVAAKIRVKWKLAKSKWAAKATDDGKH